MLSNFLCFTAPKSIVATTICSAIVGFIYLLALLFVIPNMTTFVNANSGDNQSITLAIAAFQLVLSKRGTLAFTILIIINIYFAGMSSFTVTTRIG